TGRTDDTGAEFLFNLHHIVYSPFSLVVFLLFEKTGVTYNSIAFFACFVNAYFGNRPAVLQDFDIFPAKERKNDRAPRGCSVAAGHLFFEPGRG
ncbi:MAG: hypothetical protein J6S41_07195, partial [Clostridia bacterium]|nr:hypothetical protein [Clostridia bacterium]